MGVKVFRRSSAPSVWLPSPCAAVRGAFSVFLCHRHCACKAPIMLSEACIVISELQMGLLASVRTSRLPDIEAEDSCRCPDLILHIGGVGVGWGVRVRVIQFSAHQQKGLTAPSVSMPPRTDDQGGLDLSSPAQPAGGAAHYKSSVAAREINTQLRSPSPLLLRCGLSIPRMKTAQNRRGTSCRSAMTAVRKAHSHNFPLDVAPDTVIHKHARKCRTPLTAMHFTRL